MIVDKGGEEIGLKLQVVSLKVQGVEKNFYNFPSLYVRLVFSCSVYFRSVRPVRVIGQTGPIELLIFNL
jgi:hypothetical protein